MRQFILAIISLAACLPAAAQQWEVGATAGYGSFRDKELAFFGEGDVGTSLYEIGNGVRIGGRVSFNFHDYFAHEASYVWQRAKFISTMDEFARKVLMIDESDVVIHNYYYNFVAHATRRDARVRPFATGGVGLSAFVPQVLSSTALGGETKVGYNFGGVIKLLVSEELGIRLDVRDHVTGKPFFRNNTGQLHNLETSVTFSYVF